jgi:hypothetical protein
MGCSAVQEQMRMPQTTNGWTPFLGAARTPWSESPYNARARSLSAFISAWNALKIRRNEIKLVSAFVPLGCRAGVRLPSHNKSSLIWIKYNVLRAFVTNLPLLSFW